LDLLTPPHPVLAAICDQISLGIVFLDQRDQQRLFSNRYIRSLSSSLEERIMGNILEIIRHPSDQQSRYNFSRETALDEEGITHVFGFTVYHIVQDIVVILINEIASKSVYQHSQQENQFYNKLSELVAEIAHEIGNPLSGISMSLQVLRSNLSSWPQKKVQDYVERTFNEINRLSLFLKRIRDISNENELEIRNLSLKLVIDDIHNRHREALDLKDIGFQNEVDEKVIGSIDDVALFQILLNLVKNSLHILRPKDQIRMYVESIDDYYIKLIYRNNGTPIPLEDLEKIFSPFYTTKDRGGGIGLSISLKLMTRMGGTIRAVPPEDGIGAKFELYIPTGKNR